MLHGRPAAIEWLRRVPAQETGWSTVRAITPSSDSVRVDLSATPTPHYESPRHHREHCEAAATWSRVPYVIDGVSVQVDDVDAHFERAKAAGAAILSEPADQPGIGIRHYRVEDLEGHRWMFEGPMRSDG